MIDRIIDAVDSLIDRLFDWAMGSYIRTILALFIILYCVLMMLACLVIPIAGVIGVVARLCQ